MLHKTSPNVRGWGALSIKVLCSSYICEELSIHFFPKFKIFHHIFPNSRIYVHMYLYIIPDWPLPHTEMYYTYMFTAKLIVRTWIFPLYSICKTIHKYTVAQSVSLSKPSRTDALECTFIATIPQFPFIYFFERFPVKPVLCLIQLPSASETNNFRASCMA